MNPFDDPSQKATGFEDDDVGEMEEEWGSSEEGPSSEEPVEPRAGKRPRGSSYGGKYPASRNWMKKREAAAQVDLAKFFGNVPAQNQVAICRAYASLLAAQNRGLTAAQKKTE
jgi:hypothetical protein